MARRRISPGGRGSSWRRPWVVAAAIALFVIGLDFLGWLTDTESFVFTLLLGKRRAETDAESVARIVEEELASERLDSPLLRFTDEEGKLHLKINLAAGQFLRLAPALKKRLEAEGAALLREQEETDRGRAHHLWEVRSPEGSRVRILFSCRKDGSAPEPAASKAARPFQAAVIMDDLGYSLEAARTAAGLSLPLTLSILPFSPHAVSSAQVGHEHGLEVMLHLPMESREGHETEKHTPGLLEARMPDEEIRRKVREQIYGVPYIRGANNHMGSLLTEDAGKMEAVLSVLREAGLYFIDSRTSPSSRALETARRLGVPAAGCDLFLDAPGDASALEKNLRELLRRARRRGWAVGIVHPYPETLEALKGSAALFKENGVELVPASVIVARASKK